MQRYWKEEGVFVYEKLVFDVVCGCVVMTQGQFDALPEYSTSIPTGVFVNKVWKARKMRPDARAWFQPSRLDDPWLLREYVEHPQKPDICKIESRPIILTHELWALANAVFWWLNVS